MRKLKLRSKIKNGRKKISLDKYIDLLLEAPLESIYRMFEHIYIVILRQKRIDLMKVEIQQYWNQQETSSEHDLPQLEIEVEQIADALEEEFDLNLYKKRMLLLIINEINKRKLKIVNTDIDENQDDKTLNDLSLNEFNRLFDHFFFDYYGYIDGIPYQNSKQEIDKFAVKSEIYDLMYKYNIKYPNAITKEEVIEMIISNFDLSQSDKPEFIESLKNSNKKRVLFIAKEGGLNVVVDNKKTEVIDYLIRAHELKFYKYKKYSIPEGVNQKIVKKATNKRIFSKILMTSFRLIALMLLLILSYGILDSYIALPNYLTPVHDFLYQFEIEDQSIFGIIIEYINKVIDLL